MKPWLSWSAIVGLACVQGCASVHLYPVCQYAGEVDGDTLSKYSQSVDSLLTRLEVNEHDVRTPALMPDRRYVVVRAVSWKHSQLRAVWPELGCLGRYGNADDRAKYSACRDYIAQALKLNSPGIAEDTVLCFTRDECARRGRIPSGGDADALIYCNGTH